MADPVVVTVTVPNLPVVSEVGVSGIQGPPGIVISGTAPEETDIIWADTSEVGDAVVPTGGTAGQALVKNSATDYDVVWDAPVPAVHNNDRHTGGFGQMFTPYPTVGLPLPDLQGAATFAGNILGGYMVAYPTSVPFGVTIDQMSCHVETLAADSFVRLAIYRPRNDGTLTMDLVVDAGVVDASTTGQKDISLSPGVTLTPGTYYLCASTQGTNASTVRVRSRAIANSGVFAHPTSSFFGNNPGFWGLFKNQGTTNAAFPDPVTFTEATSIIRPLVALRVGSVL